MCPVVLTKSGDDITRKIMVNYNSSRKLGSYKPETLTEVTYFFKVFAKQHLLCQAKKCG